MKTCTELAAELGVTQRTLRFYEDRGLVTPHREGRQRVRLYDDEQAKRVKDALRYARYGFSLCEIRKGIDRRALIDRRAEIPGEIAEREAALIEITRELDAMEDGSYG